MMAPSGLYRIPRSDLPRPRTEVERFAVLEYGSPTVAWRVPVSAEAVTERRGVFSEFFARIRARSAAARATPRPAPAAVHLADGGLRESLHPHRLRPHPDLDGPFQADPALFHTLHAAADEEVCECPP